MKIEFTPQERVLFNINYEKYTRMGLEPKEARERAVNSIIEHRAYLMDEH